MKKINNTFQLKPKVKEKTTHNWIGVFGRLNILSPNQHPPKFETMGQVKMALKGGFWV